MIDEITTLVNVFLLQDIVNVILRLESADGGDLANFYPA